MAARYASLLIVLFSLLPHSVLAEPAPDFSIATCPEFVAQSRTLITQGEVNVEDLEFIACNGRTIKAYWVGLSARPTHSQAAILFVHWYEPSSADSNRDEFLEEAKSLAQRGVVSLLVSTFWSEPNAPYHQRRWQNDYENSLNQTRDLRRALDWIKRQHEVDSSRLAYVGHDYGAGFGALLAGLDDSVKGFALLTTPPTLSDWYLFGSASGKPEGPELARFKERFKTLAPATFLSNSKAQLLLQFGNKDPYVSPAQAKQVANAAPNAKVLHYEVGHDMKLAQVREDRDTWLGKVLGLVSP